MKVAARMNSFHEVHEREERSVATAGLANSSTIRQRSSPPKHLEIDRGFLQLLGMVSSSLSIQTLKGMEVVA